MKNKRVQSENGSLRFLIWYLLFSFFLGLVFSIFALRARNRGKYGFGWMFLSLLSCAFFGTIAFSLLKTSSPMHDAGWYYLGASTLITNGIAVFILVITLFKKRNGFTP
jgi:drug/metabolite transporter (DMT)-like permease